MMARGPVVGIGAGLDDKDIKARRAYALAIERAGGVPILLPPIGGPADALADAHLGLIDALVLTGGDDPVMEPFGVATDPRVTPIERARQEYDLALIREARRRDMPALGVCLGMQLMALEAGGALDQWIRDTTPTHADHFDDRAHAIAPIDGGGDGIIHEGAVTSWHRQAVSDAGRMRVIGRAHDGVIEAIDDPSLRLFVGVQWHPERTEDRSLGGGLFERLIEAARAGRERSVV